MHDTKGFILGGLSSELIVNILHYCECSTILRFAVTCKAYHELVTHTTSLQLHIELEANGMEIVKGSFKEDATYSAILKDLKQFRDAWLNLDFGEPIVRTVWKSGVLLWQLREGFYIVAFAQSGRGDADTIQYFPLDPEAPDPPPLLFDFTFSDFTADPGQGLVAIISRDSDQVHVDLCSSTTGLACPLAECPRLTARFGRDFPLSSSQYAIESMGHIMLAKIYYTEGNIYEFLIWDWRSGTFLQRICSQEGICAFTFLDQQHLALLNVARSGSSQDTISLLIYAISETMSTLLHLSSDEQRRVEDYATSEPVLHLEFPRLKGSSKIAEDRFIIQSEPLPGRILYTKSASFACPYAMTLSIIFSFKGSDFDLGISDHHCVFVDGWSLLKHVI
ncbi:hypothetical protein B0J17DRAFT_42074 [Rhizoctonia solani]|nr:hypothetical protein B0J17DRAFT_42074 [Rhizoctonia solani]